MKTDQPIELVKTDTTMGDYYAHPAFAQIRASRVSGNATLYGSDFRHQHYVTISICRSELVRSLSREWHFGRNELISIALSEAQWASFVSSTNVGSGSPCTLQHLDGRQVPTIPLQAPKSEKFSEDIQKALAEVQARLHGIANELDADNVGRKKLRELRDAIRVAATHIASNTGFVADSFDEHMENTVERARVEINAYAVATIHAAGLGAIASDAPLKLIGGDGSDNGFPEVRHG